MPSKNLYLLFEIITIKTTTVKLPKCTIKVLNYSIKYVDSGPEVLYTTLCSIFGGFYFFFKNLIMY